MIKNGDDGRWMDGCWFMTSRAKWVIGPLARRVSVPEKSMNSGIKGERQNFDFNLIIHITIPIFNNKIV